jgi:hypothetical protein
MRRAYAVPETHEPDALPGPVDAQERAHTRARVRGEDEINAPHTEFLKLPMCAPEDLCSSVFVCVLLWL